VCERDTMGRGADVDINNLHVYNAYPSSSAFLRPKEFDKKKKLSCVLCGRSFVGGSWWWPGHRLSQSGWKIFFLYKRKTDTTKGDLKRKANKQTREREKKGVWIHLDYTHTHRECV
jgi:hypothetical protein